MRFDRFSSVMEKSGLFYTKNAHSISSGRRYQNEFIVLSFVFCLASIMLAHSDPVHDLQPVSALLKAQRIAIHAIVSIGS